MRWHLYTGLLAALLLISSSSVHCQEDDFETDDIHVSENVNVKVDTPKAPEVTEYKSPVAAPGKYYLAEHFDNVAEVNKKWVRSQAKKDDTSEEIAKYDGVWEVEAPHRPILDGDLGLVLKSKAKHAAISTRLAKPFVFADKPFVVQYEVTLQEGQECGGAYLKLLSSGKETSDLQKFNDKTPYTIMFGPDKCGNDIKLHFIFRHVNPRNKTITEKHCKKSKDRLEEPFKDKQPHLYQLVIRPDNSFEIRVDHKIVNEGSLLTMFDPPVNPPREIDDPTDHKPSDWDEREKIPDPDATKPEDWDEDEPPQIPDPSSSKPEAWLDDEEEMIPDPTAVKPEDWDTEIDGEWEAPLITNPVCEKAVGCGLWQAPMIDNPNYKGKWRAPLIDNPNYQGKWAPKKIPNPDFFEDLQPFRMTTIAAVGIELWSMSNEILFDNIVVTDDVKAADEWAAQTYDVKRQQLDKDAETLVQRLMKYTEANPWMWGVYVVVIGLPLAIAIFFMCSSGKDKSATHPKKTDEPTADDDDPAAGGDNKQQQQSKKGKSSKTDLNSKAAKEAVVEEDAEQESVEEEEIQESVEEEEEEAAPEPVPVKAAPKKKKARKGE